ncbi:MAG: ribonuclease E/G, partial [Pseudorhodoplanes sp.]
PAPFEEQVLPASVHEAEAHDEPAHEIETFIRRDDEPAEFEEATVAPEAGEARDAAQPDAATAEGENGDGENGENGDEAAHEEEVVESVGGDADMMDEVPDRTRRFRRQYKIQEVIKRRQVMLVQVVKEERGTKGAALTTYLSLAGRYSVLMPNTARGGGISRKVTNAEDRRRMKEIAEELQVPEGMGVILRTAGANRSNAEIKRDFEYLLRLWETVRDLTLRSQAPTLVYEEGSLIKRSIRDLYHKDIDEILVEGDAAYQEAKEFMRMLMPSHVQNVVSYRDTQPIFTRYGIEAQLDAMFSPTVQLKSGGYIVINQTEALVAIDVNSGRATREHSIEETALKTNSEAAAEIARQLRLRDLAGLIVIDFIDMDEKRNNRTVERKLKDALKDDRARIQVGRISHFGLMEMSRQRLRASVLESSTETCPHCGGTGHVRSVSSVALQLLRALDDTLMRGSTHNLIARTRADVAIYVLNHKRAHLRGLEERYKVAITVTTDPTLTSIPAYAIDRGEQVMSAEQARALAVQFDRAMPRPADEDAEESEALEPAGDEAAETDGEASGEDEGRGERDGRRRRRGRRGGRGRHRREDRDDTATAAAPEADAADFDPAASGADEVEADAGAAASEPRDDDGADEGPRRRRRGRRGGRRNRREDQEEREEAAAQPYERDGADDMRGHAEPGPEFRPAEEPAPHTAPAPAPAPQPPADIPAPAPRRRSTVREPAPMLGTADEAPAFAPPAPAQPEPEAAAETNGEGEKPRRFGWWSKRS